MLAALATQLPAPPTAPPARRAVEREKESKEALLHQKRRITRQWEVLARLKKRCGGSGRLRWAGLPQLLRLRICPCITPPTTHPPHHLPRRYAAADARAAADNARLSDEYTAVARAFAHLQRKVRHFEAADVARFEQVGRCVCGWLLCLVAGLPHSLWGCVPACCALEPAPPWHPPSPLPCPPRCAP